MKAKNWILIVGLVIVIGVGASFIYWQMTAYKFPYSKDDYSIPLELTYDDPADFNYYDIFIDQGGSDGREYYDGSQVDLGGSIRDGAVFWGEPPLVGGNLKSQIQIGRGLYLRFKAVSDNFCQAQVIWAATDQQEGDPNLYGVGFGGCSYQTLSMELPNLSEDQVRSLVRREEGALILEPDTWIESLVWIEEEAGPDGTRLVANGFAWKSTDPQQYIAVKVELPGFDQADYMVFSHENYNGVTATDTLRIIGKGNLAYLYYNSPAFKINAENLMDFFTVPLDPQDTPLLTVPAEGEAVQTPAEDQPEEQQTPAEDSSQGGEADAAAEEVPQEDPEASPTGGGSPYQGFLQEIKPEFLNGLLKAEDLDPEYAFYETWRTILYTQDGLIYRNEILQGNNKGGGSIYFRTSVMRVEQDFDQESFRTWMLDDPEGQTVNEGVPIVGQASLSFRELPYDRYAFYKDGWVVEIRCRSGATNFTPYCRPENMALFAEVVADRLPLEMSSPLQIAYPQEMIMDPSPISDLRIDWADDKESVCWTNQDYLPDLQILYYEKDLQLAELFYDQAAIDKLGVGPQCVYLPYTWMGTDKPTQHYDITLVSDCVILGSVEKDFTGGFE